MMQSAGMWLRVKVPSVRLGNEVFTSSCDGVHGTDSDFLGGVIEAVSGEVAVGTP